MREIIHLAPERLARRRTSIRIPAFKPTDLDGIYVVYNNEIDLTWWQCHITKYCRVLRKIKGETEGVMLSHDTSSVYRGWEKHIHLRIEACVLLKEIYFWWYKSNRTGFLSLAWIRESNLGCFKTTHLVRAPFLELISAFSRRANGGKWDRLTSHHDARQYQLSTLFVRPRTCFDGLILLAIYDRYRRRYWRR